MICKKCGYEFSIGKFCPECGAKYENDIVSEMDINVDVTECIEENEEPKDVEIKEKKKADKQAIISLVLGILSWISILTVIIPLICGCWSIIDGIKALRGGTKHKKSAISGCILSVLILVFLIGVIVSSDDIQDVSNTNPTEIEMTESNETETDELEETEKEPSESIDVIPEIIVSGDLYTDVESGVLYSNENGKITDVNGRVLDIYNYLTVLENGAISDGECILEGIFAGAGGKIVIDMPGDVTYEDNSTAASTKEIGLISGHYTTPNSPIVFTIEDAIYSDGSDILVGIKIYYGTLDNLYAGEYIGMVSLMELGSVTIQDGFQSFKYFKYRDGVIDGSGLTSIAKTYCSNHQIKYDDSASSTYYLDDDLSTVIEYENAQIDCEGMYGEIIDDVISKYGRVVYYMLYDLNRDGKMELFIMPGITSDVEVYSTNGEKPFYVGKIIADGAKEFYESIDGNGIYLLAGQKMYRVSYENDIKCEFLYDAPLDISNYKEVGEYIGFRNLINGFYW